jgi:hypothetical protein
VCEVQRLGPRKEQGGAVGKLEGLNPVAQDAVVIDPYANPRETPLEDARRRKRMEALVGMLNDQQLRFVLDPCEELAEAQCARPIARITDLTMLGRRTAFPVDGVFGGAARCVDDVDDVANGSVRAFVHEDLRVFAEQNLDLARPGAALTNPAAERLVIDSIPALEGTEDRVGLRRLFKVGLDDLGRV